jgi:hypothetical protein
MDARYLPEHESALGVMPRGLDDEHGMLVYLSCTIQKGPTDMRAPDFFCGEEEIKRLLAPVTSSPVTLLDPAKSGCRRNDIYANYGCDLYMISISNVVVVDARTEKGVGVGAELMYARERGIPVVAVCPPETNYRRSLVEDVCGEDLRAWVHPFIYSLSSIIVDDFDAAGSVLEAIASGRLSLPPVADPDKAVSHYLRAREQWAREGSISKSR